MTGRGDASEIRERQGRKAAFVAGAGRAQGRDVGAGEVPCGVREGETLSAAQRRGLSSPPVLRVFLDFDWGIRYNFVEL